MSPERMISNRPFGKSHTSSAFERSFSVTQRLTIKAPAQMCCRSHRKLLHRSSADRTNKPLRQSRKLLTGGLRRATASKRQNVMPAPIPPHQHQERLILPGVSPLHDGLPLSWHICRKHRGMALWQIPWGGRPRRDASQSTTMKKRAVIDPVSSSVANDCLREPKTSGETCCGTVLDLLAAHRLIRFLPHAMTAANPGTT